MSFIDTPTTRVSRCPVVVVLMKYPKASLLVVLLGFLASSTLLLSRVLCSQQGHVIHPVFPAESPVKDISNGSLEVLFLLLQRSSFNFVMYYAHWCAQSTKLVYDFHRASRKFEGQVSFIAINCWTGSCGQNSQLHTYPQLFFHHTSYNPVQYKGRQKYIHLVKFIQDVIYPFTYISNSIVLQEFLGKRKPSLLAFFNGTDYQNKKYDSFFGAALRSVTKVSSLQFGVVTSFQVARLTGLEKFEQVVLTNALGPPQLVSDLAEQAPHVAIDLIQVANVGWCLRFNPLVSAATSRTTNDSVDHFIKSLEAKISAFDATLSDRTGLHTAMEEKRDMVLVDIPDFPGVGAVQFIPQYWKSKDLKNLPTAKQQELDELNSDVLLKLSDKTLFSKGETPTGRVCIKIGLVNRTVSVPEIIELLEKTVKEVQESSKFMEKMADVIRKGIEAAEHDLVQDSNDILLEEGLLRQVPIVSSVFNWLSPLQHEKKVKGRTFDLSSGHLHTTEKTYKYHMQVQDDDENESSEKPSDKE